MVYTISKNTVTISEDAGRRWKQVILSIIAYFPFFTRSLQTTFLSSIPEDQLPKTDNGVPWTDTAFILGTLASSILCLVADKYGRKVVAFIVTVLQAISWIILLSETTPTNLVIASALIGISSSGIFTILPIYVREIFTSPLSAVLSVMMMMTSLGYLVMSVMMMWVAQSRVIYVVMGLVALQFLMMFFLIETPSYFVKIGNKERATDSSAKINCLPADDSTVIKRISNLCAESERARSGGKINLYSMLITNKIWRDAIKIVATLVACYQLGGNLFLCDHTKVLRILAFDHHKDVGNLVAPAVMVVGSLLCFLGLLAVEQRYLLTVSFTMTAVSLGVLGVFTQAHLPSATVPWLPVTAFVLALLGYAAGWGLPFVLMNELFNLEIRATIIGFLYTYGQLLRLVHVHTYGYLEDYMGTYVLCYIFSGVNLYGAVYCLFGVPVTRERTVRQIERKLKRIPIWKL